MPFPKDFPSTADLARVKAEDEYYLLYNADLAFADDLTPRGKFRLEEFFSNDTQKAKILDTALHLAPLAVDAGTDFLFGKPVKIEVDSEDEKFKQTKVSIDAIVKRLKLQQRLKESATLFQTVGHAHFKVYATQEDGKTVAMVEEQPYDYWHPNWSGVPLGQESNDVRLVVYLTNVDDSGKETKYIYIENYYLEGVGKDRKCLCAKSLWQDKGGKIGDQVPLSACSIAVSANAQPLEGKPETKVEETGLAELPLVSLHVRKTVKERYGQSILKKALPILHQINDRLTQLSVQFLKHLNAKLMLPEASIERDQQTGEILSKNLEVLLARQGEDAKYITNDNPLIEQAFVFLEKLIRKFAKLTQTPDTFLTEDEKGGVEKVESLRTRLMFFLRRIENYDTTYREGIERLVRLCLTIEKDENAATVPLKITFDPGLPKEWTTDAQVWGDALASGLASEETAVSRFQDITGDKLKEELKRIDADKQKFMQSQLDLKTAVPVGSEPSDAPNGNV